MKSFVMKSATFSILKTESLILNSISLALLVLVLFIFIAPVEVSHAATISAASASHADVSAAVNQASSGDTVVVPAGSQTWNSPLVITTGLTLQGAGMGNTVIIANFSEANTGIIKYAPASPYLNEHFRVTGFTLNANYMTSPIFLHNPTITKIDRVRIDHNRLINAGGVYSHRAIYIVGTVYGVIDSNIIESKIGPSSYGLQGNSWKNLSRDFGSADNIYYEDNILIGNDMYHYNGHGGRFVARYNTYSGTDRDLYGLMDMHGNQPGSIYATMVGEIYGNLVHMNGYNGALLGHRGGQALVFFNHIANAGPSFTAVRVVEEYNDNLTGENYLQRVTNSYYWNNRKNEGTPITSYIFGQCDAGCGQTCLHDYSCGYCLAFNKDVFEQGSSFNGTSGVGCGRLANRPATCTTGVGYWATEQSCSNLTGMVGTNPVTPILGTLYKCTSTNTWTAYYAPYQYPHPLRTGVSQPPPQPAPEPTPPATVSETTKTLVVKATPPGQLKKISR